MPASFPQDCPKVWRSGVPNVKGSRPADLPCKANYKISWMCRLLGVPRSSFYARRNRAEIAAAARRRELNQSSSSRPSSSRTWRLRVPVGCGEAEPGRASVQRRPGRESDTRAGVCGLPASRGPISAPCAPSRRRLAEKPICRSAGRLVQLLADPEVARVVNSGFGTDCLAGLVLLHDLGVRVVDVHPRGDVRGDDPGAEPARGGARAFADDAAAEDQAGLVRPANAEVVAGCGRRSLSARRTQAGPRSAQSECQHFQGNPGLVAAPLW
jgi:hypothetical protein